MPEGLPVGTRGSNELIRNVAGGLPAAKKMFEELASLGQQMENPRYPGLMAEVPLLGKIGLRPKSVSGEPTLDVYATIGGIKIDKIKFVE